MLCEMRKTVSVRPNLVFVGGKIPAHPRLPGSGCGSAPSFDLLRTHDASSVTRTEASDLHWAEVFIARSMLLMSVNEEIKPRGEGFAVGHLRL